MMVRFCILLIISTIFIGCSKGNKSKSQGIAKEYCSQDAKKLLKENTQTDPDDGYDAKTATFITPTKKLINEDIPYFQDDLDFEGMDLVVERQLRRFRQLPSTHKIKLGEEVYPLAAATTSLLRLRELIHDYKQCLTGLPREQCTEELNVKLKARFNVYAPNLQEGDPRFGEEHTTLFTGYYTPVLEAAKTANKEFQHAVYKKPYEKNLRSTVRVDIDFKEKIAGKGYEIFYTRNLFDVYLLHVQGGGRVNFIDGSKTSHEYLSYDGTNGQSWSFISKYMIEKNYIRDGSVISQRKFLDANPNHAYEIFQSCPSYVYFKSTSHPPEGSDRVSLTDGRSIATDVNLYRLKGLIAFVDAKRPVEKQKPEDCNAVKFRSFQRFFLDQDTGGAIKGKGRVDIYFGEGAYAELAAYNTVQKGNLYFLMAKK